MSTLANWFKFLVSRQALKRTRIDFGSHVRTLTDTPDVSKKVMVQGTENEERVRVRRARPADVPRVLRFVREHAGRAWPGLAPPPAAPQLLLCDYVARALAQGHSMVAEQQEARRGWAAIRGVAVGAAVCPWDAALLERWASGVRCARSRRLLAFAAHCLRAPALHDKHRVHTILQVILIVPESAKSSDVINVLVKNAIKRGREVGFPLIRFDVTDDTTAKILEELNLQKEWQLAYDILPEAIKDTEASDSSVKPTTTSKDKLESNDRQNSKATFKHQVIVYSARTKSDKS